EAAAVADTARPAVLADEERPRSRVGPTGGRVGEPRVPGRDQDAAAGVEDVGEVVAEPPVLAGRDARGAALADPADVHDPAGGVDDRLLRRLAGRVRDRRLHDVDVPGLAVEVGHAVLRLGLVPDAGDIAGVAGRDPRPEPA